MFSSFKASLSNVNKLIKRKIIQYGSWKYLEVHLTRRKTNILYEKEGWRICKSLLSIPIAPAQVLCFMFGSSLEMEIDLHNIYIV